MNLQLVVIAITVFCFLLCLAIAQVTIIPLVPSDIITFRSSVISNYPVCLNSFKTIETFWAITSFCVVVLFVQQTQSGRLSTEFQELTKCIVRSGIELDFFSSDHPGHLKVVSYDRFSSLTIIPIVQIELKSYACPIHFSEVITFASPQFERIQAIGTSLVDYSNKQACLTIQVQFAMRQNGIVVWCGAVQKQCGAVRTDLGWLCFANLSRSFLSNQVEDQFLCGIYFTIFVLYFLYRNPTNTRFQSVWTASTSTCSEGEFPQVLDQ